MVGVWMGLVALLVIPGGLLLAWWMVRQLERAAADGDRGRDRAGLVADSRERRPHPATQPPARGSGALDDAPAEVIAALARQLAAQADEPRRPGDAA